MIKTKNPLKLLGAGIVIAVMLGYMLVHNAKCLVKTGSLWD